MTAEDIKNLITSGEGLRVEFKEARNSVPSSFYETVVSFSNTDGGTILLGVHDNGNVTGIDPANELKIKRDLVTAINSPDCINPPLYILPFSIQLPDGLVMVVQVSASSQVHNHKGGIYIREADADINITNNQNAVSDLYHKKRNFFTESEIYPYLTLNDLDQALFDKARQLIKNNKSDHPWLIGSDEQMLKDSLLWRKDYLKNQEGLTLAAALIFGKDTTIQNLLPAYKVEAILRIKNLDRWDDRITLRTNLIDTYYELKRFIDKHLPDKFYLEGDQRIDLRDKIFREVIGNIIVHREYTSALSTDMIISGNEVVTTNPNRALFHGIIDLNSFNPYPKNPNIRKFFTSFGWSDEIGSGIRNTKKYVPLYSSCALPVFLEDEAFRIVIPLINFTWNEKAPILVEFLGMELSAFGLNRINLLKQLPLNSENDDSENPDMFFYQKGISWYQKGDNLFSLNYQKYKSLSLDDFKKGTTWSEKGDKFLAKRFRNLLKLLTCTIEPVSIDELLSLLDFKSRDKFWEMYLTPLRKNGLIEQTIKDKPNSPAQKYVITEAGKIFLGGI